MSNTGIITYPDDMGTQKIYVFWIRGLSLYVNYWDGSQWKQSEQVTPPGLHFSGYPAVVSDLATPTHRLYVFIRSIGGRLWLNHWDGSQWNWNNQGTPPGTLVEYRIGNAPAVISYQESGLQRVQAFVLGESQHLHANYWDGFQWQWADQGRPPDVLLWGEPEAITFEEAGTTQIYVFVRSGDGRLWINYWNGSQWQWIDQGRPPSTGMVESPGAITYEEAGRRKIYAFIKGFDRHLYVNYWDGFQWQWDDQGTPPGTFVSNWSGNAIGVITYAEGDVQKIYAFIKAENGHLYVNYWDGFRWQWADQGTPPKTMVVSVLGAVTYEEAGRQKICAFVEGSDRQLYENYWNGSEWRWVDPRKPVPYLPSLPKIN